MASGLVVERRKGRIGSQLHQRRLHQDLFQGYVAQRSFVTAIVPGTGLHHGLPGHVAQGLGEAAIVLVDQIDGFDGPEVVAPAIDAKQHLLQHRFTLGQEHQIEQRAVHQHADGNGVACQQGRVGFRLLKGQRRALNQQAGGSDVLANRQSVNGCQFLANILKAKVVGYEHQQQVETGLEQR